MIYIGFRAIIDTTKAKEIKKMTREERNEFNYIKRSLKNLGDRWANLTIRTDASSEYKQALHEFYTSLGFHPAAIKVDTRWFDDKERIIYIRGIETDGIHWTRLYTAEEKAAFEAALR